MIVHAEELAARRPLPDTGAAVAGRGNADRDVIFLIQGVPERRPEAASGAGIVSAWLWVGGKSPGGSAERRNHA